VTARLSLVRVAALALALFVAACGSGADGETEAPPAPPETAAVTIGRWDDAAAVLRPGVDPSSPNPCQRGDRSCFDLVIAELEQQAEELGASCDHNAVFAVLYLRTTEAVAEAARAGRFADPAAVSHLTAWFARYYFAAYDDWRAGRSVGIPAAWQLALDAADRRSAHAIGNLLLGMNAHITRDLAYAVAELRPPPGAGVDPDFQLVNEIIAETSDAAVREIADRFDPTLTPASLPLALDGASSLRELITIWRLEAWHNGILLAEASAEERPAVRAAIETSARLRALSITAATSYLPVVEGPEDRDAHCASVVSG
jgi:hypothetical protein